MGDGVARGGMAGIGKVCILLLKQKYLQDEIYTVKPLLFLFLSNSLISEAKPARVHSSSR